MRALAFALALCVLAGCRQERKKVVAVIPKATSHIFWLSVHAGAAAAAREYDLDLDWSGPQSETEYSRQIQILDSMVARRVDGICIAACERRALIGPVERAVRAGIPVTIFDSGLDSDNYMSYVATDNVEAGRMGARKLAELLGGKGKVAILMHAPGSVSTTDREVGFEEVVERQHPGIQIVARQFGMSDRGKTMAAAENMLTAHPDLDGMFCSTEPSCSGAALAVKARGLPGKLKLVAFDFSDTMIEDLRAGVIDAMVVQDPFRMGFEAVKTIAGKLRGQQPPKRLDLQARVITRPDLDTPEIRKLLQPDLKAVGQTSGLPAARGIE